jgi:glycosyltransferase involved in cell wall biosynthesis
MHSGEINLHIYPSTFTHESRILRITRTLIAAGVFEKILVLARWANGLAETEAIDESRQVWRIRRKLTESHSGAIWKALGTLEWSARLITRTRGLAISCINSHSLPVLPVCVVLKYLKGAKLIYDTHELETEGPHLRGVRQKLSKILERNLIKFVDEIVVVNESIADWYRREYGLKNVRVVQNVPDRPLTLPEKTDLLRKKFDLAPDSIVYLHHGILGQARGIELLLDIFAGARPGNQLVLMGFGPLTELAKDYARRYSNIHFHEAVKPEELGPLVASADVGIFLVPNICLSYYLALSNKFFEYINSGLPVLISDFPEFHKIISKYDCGWLIAEDEKAISQLINEVSADEVAEKKANAIRARKDFGWEFEEPKLLQVYEELGFC